MSDKIEKCDLVQSSPIDYLQVKGTLEGQQNQEYFRQGIVIYEKNVCFQSEYLLNSTSYMSFY